VKECAAGAEAGEEGEEGKREGGMRRWLEVKSLPVHQLPRRDRSQEEKKRSRYPSQLLDTRKRGRRGREGKQIEGSEDFRAGKRRRRRRSCHEGPAEEKVSCISLHGSTKSRI